MKKIAVITDSNSGLQKNDESKDLYVIPMPFIIDDKTYLEGAEISNEQFYEFLEGEHDVTTSQPILEHVVSLYRKLMETYDEVVHIPMSSSLSNTYETAVLIANQIAPGRIHVVNNRKISMMQKESAFEALELAKRGLTGAEIKPELEKKSSDGRIYLAVDTLKYLKKGGRITPAVAAIGTLLRIKPVLKVEGGKLDTFAKVRTASQAKKLMVEQLRKDFESLYNSDSEKVHIGIAHAKAEKEALELKEELLREFTFLDDIPIDNLSLSVSTHTGPGSLGILIYGKMK